MLDLFSFGQDSSDNRHFDKTRVAGLSRLLSGILRIHRINDLHRKYADSTDDEFINAVFKELDIDLKIFEPELGSIPKEGAFILVSNHPLGGLDGLIVLKVVAALRPDLKILAEFQLSEVRSLNHFFFQGSLNESEVINNPNMSLSEKARKHLEAGKPICLFPAGEVSIYNLRSKSIRDKRWRQEYVEFVKESRVPVVPFYISGRNALLFHLLQSLSPSIRSSFVQENLLKSQDRLITIRIGKPISIKDQDEFPNPYEYGRYLRIRTYLLGKPINVKHFFRPNRSKKGYREIVEQRDIKLLNEEISYLRESGFLLYENGRYQVLWTTSERSPNVLYEIGRLREITFREVGEGTGKNIDLDEYDLYYRHLFIWDVEENALVGAYRLGMGKEIIDRFGKTGFYLNSLFKLKRRFLGILEQSIELGRSFITSEYQLKPLSLFLLWKGILYYILKNPEYRYLIGPVSISGEFSELSKSLIIKHIRENHFDRELASMVIPRKEFIPDQDINDPDLALVDRYTGEDLKKLDRVIEDIELGKFRLPALLKKYLGQNAKIIAFNVDPDFNNALDGLLVMDLFNVPMSTLEGLAKEFEDKEVLANIKEGKIGR